MVRDGRFCRNGGSCAKARRVRGQKSPPQRRGGAEIHGFRGQPGASSWIMPGAKRKMGSILTLEKLFRLEEKNEMEPVDNHHPSVRRVCGNRAFDRIPGPLRLLGSDFRFLEASDAPKHPPDCLFLISRLMLFYIII